MIWKWHCGGRRKKVITAKNHSAFPHLLTNNWVKLLGSLIKTKILKYEYWKKQPWFENKLHGFHHSMKLESQWGHWEIKSLHSSKKTNLALTQNQMWAVVQRRGRVKKEEAIGGEWSKGAGAGGWKHEEQQRKGLLHNCLFSCKTIKEQYVGLFTTEQKAPSALGWPGLSFHPMSR